MGLLTPDLVIRGPIVIWRGAHPTSLPIVRGGRLLTSRWACLKAVFLVWGRATISTRGRRAADPQQCLDCRRSAHFRMEWHPPIIPDTGVLGIPGLRVAHRDPCPD